MLWRCAMRKRSPPWLGATHAVAQAEASAREDGGAACDRLHAFAGHDLRFVDAAAAVEAGLGANGDPHAIASHVQTTLGRVDRSADYVSQPVGDIVAEAMRVGAPAQGIRNAAR